MGARSSLRPRRAERNMSRQRWIGGESAGSDGAWHQGVDPDPKPPQRLGQFPHKHRQCRFGCAVVREIARRVGVQRVSIRNDPGWRAAMRCRAKSRARWKPASTLTACICAHVSWVTANVWSASRRAGAALWTKCDPVVFLTYSSFSSEAGTLWKRSAGEGSPSQSTNTIRR
jgi:hypothetical protein